MLRLIARLTLLLVVVTAAVLLLMRVQHDGSDQIDRFFNACTPMPCWQGIRPGETTLSQALALLRANPWIASTSEVYASSYPNTLQTVLIYWTWSSSYPFANTGTTVQQGIIITDNEVVRQVYLTTNLPLGELWLALGDPQGGMVDYIYDTQHMHVDDTALFIQQGVAATASLTTDCSDEYLNFWSAPVYLWLQTNVTLANNSAAYPSYMHMLRTGYHQVRSSSC